jgi:hypothetical protein
MPRTIKRHDTADPITGTVRQTDRVIGSPTFGQLIRADLTAFVTLNFQIKVEGAPTVVTGVAVNVEVADGPGANQPDGLPLNRGKFRYEQVDGDVDTTSVYDVELECILANGKKVHFPNSKVANDKLTIDDDLDNT